MICPACHNENRDDALLCDFCQALFRKEKPATRADEPVTPVVAADVPRARFAGLRLPAVLALAVALPFTWHFRDYLPITEGWARFETWLLPLSMSDLAFHEGGHPIFGLLSLGNTFITAAGGTLMQLLIPTVCGFEFIRRKSFSGVLFVLFWLGENLAAISLYAADAKQQVLILITGMSGSEGGMHDWGYMFGQLHLTNYCVGIAQVFFFTGCFLMAFAPFWGLLTLLRRTGWLPEIPFLNPPARPDGSSP